MKAYSNKAKRVRLSSKENLRVKMNPILKCEGTVT